MTKNQIERKLTKAGMELNNLEISRDEIEIFIPDSDDPGVADCDLTETLMNKIASVINWGGFKCGHGGWVLQRDYKMYNTR